MSTRGDMSSHGPKDILWIYHQTLGNHFVSWMAPEATTMNEVVGLLLQQVFIFHD